MKEVNLEKFNGFMKPKEKPQQAKKIEKKRIIGYTRVSSKRQIEGFSIEEQERSIREFAKANNYDLIDIKGGQYESAKGDFTRKEFKALIEMCTKMKPKKPYAIAIKFISRFSRSGGSAIGLVDDLVTKNGIHLIETSTGICTDNDEGKIQIYHKLLDAWEENKQLLERTLPGMKSFLEAGNWLGKTPFGYDTYGKRVIDDDKLRGKQKIVLNKDGEHLKEAWRWKVLGWSDAQIKKELWDRYKMKISICRLGYIWKNPFYAGVCISKLLDKPVRGNWEAIVSEQDFLKINHKDDGFKERSYNTEGNAEYPLAHFAVCSQCGRILVGYTNKKRGISYYKCMTCRKNYNADTLEHSRNKGINDVFADVLKQYSLDARFKEPVKYNVTELICGDISIDECIKELDKQIDEISNKEEALDEKYAYEGFPKAKYDVMSTKLQDEKLRLELERDELVERKSNSVDDVENVIEIICNTLKYWKLDDLGTKKMVQETVFPQGILINPENREVLTREVNPFFVKKDCKSTDYEVKKKMSEADNQSRLHSVAGMRIELMTSGL